VARQVAKKSINQIVLHALDLDISEARPLSADKLHSEDADEYSFAHAPPHTHTPHRTRTTAHAHDLRDSGDAMGRVRFDTANDFLILEFASLSKWLETSSEFVLQLTFNGTLKTSMSGFYRYMFSSHVYVSCVSCAMCVSCRVVSFAGADPQSQELLRCRRQDRVVGRHGL
jgi:hypothetical protein